MAIRTRPGRATVLLTLKGESAISAPYTQIICRQYKQKYNGLTELVDPAADYQEEAYKLLEKLGIPRTLAPLSHIGIIATPQGVSNYFTAPVILTGKEGVRDWLKERAKARLVLFGPEEFVTKPFYKPTRLFLFLWRMHGYSPWMFLDIETKFNQSEVDGFEHLRVKVL